MVRDAGWQSRKHIGFKAKPKFDHRLSFAVCVSLGKLLLLSELPLSLLLKEPSFCV